MNPAAGKVAFRKKNNKRFSANGKQRIHEEIGKSVSCEGTLRWRKEGAKNGRLAATFLFQSATADKHRPNVMAQIIRLIAEIECFSR